MTAGAKKILVTGGAGFIGTHLCRAFLKNRESSEGYRISQIRVLDIAEPSTPVEGVEYIRGDIRNEKDLETAIQDIDCVYHMAAIVSVPVCQANPVESYQTNFLDESAGGDKFDDFLRVGIPLTIIMWAGFSIILPMLYQLKLLQCLTI